jgi:hypothetical protein
MPDRDRHYTLAVSMAAHALPGFLTHALIPRCRTLALSLCPVAAPLAFEAASRRSAGSVRRDRRGVRIAHWSANPGDRRPFLARSIRVRRQLAQAGPP